jgi:RHS repeat-associated protein
MNSKQISIFIILIYSIFFAAFAQDVESAAVALEGVGVARVENGRVALRCHGLSLAADSVSSASYTTFYALPLRSEQLHPVPATLKLVCAGKCQGYRLLPNGDHFPKGATLRLAYDPTKIPAGHSYRDIRTYYYDESAREWKALKLIEIDTINKEVVSLTTHFTDFINGVMQEPEAPEVEGFVPTTMSKRPAAEPLAGLPLIEPPSANSGGTAELSYPLALPAGRNGMQPALALTYSSGGGDGWLGAGWDIATPKITVETRWGVPRYNPAKESDIYLYNGNQLVTKDNGGHFDPMPHRTNTWQKRKPSGTQFFPRIEGAFDSIVRRGSHVWSYWWEVTDRSGVKYYYGKSHSADTADEAATLHDDQGNIAEWYLTEIRDLYGNAVRYYYTDHSSGNGKEKCLLRINYTGFGSNTGHYDVVFETEAANAGKQNDCRYGFRKDNSRLLKTVKIKYDGRTIGAYLFGYDNGDSTMYRNRLYGFGLVDSNQYNNSQSIDTKIDAIHTAGLRTYISSQDYPNLWYYDFDYYNAPDAAHQFGNETTIDLEDDNVRSDFLTDPFNISGMGGATALGATKGGSIGIGGGAGVGCGANVALTTFSGGGSYNASWGKSTGMLTLMDLDGDGLPDKVFRKSDGVYYRKHIRDSETTHHYAPAEKVEGIEEFLEEKSFSSTWGIQASVAVAGVNGSYGTDKSRTRVYFSDVNGDGLPDLVTPDGVKFNQLENGVPTFTTTAAADGTVTTNSMPCGRIIHDGAVSDSILCRIEKEEVCRGTINETYAPLMERLLGGDELTESELAALLSSSGVDEECEECFRGTGHHIEYDRFTKEFVCCRLTTICEGNGEPQLDAVRVWVAPISGNIQITSTLQMDNSGNTPHNADGVWCSIQHESNVSDQGDRLQSAASDTLWSIGLAKDDNSQHTKNIQLTVAEGDVLMFRLNSKNNRNADNILWDNTIEYTNTPQNNDRYGKADYRYNSGEDFVMSDNSYFQAVTAGTVRLKDNPQIASGDTALYKVYKNGMLARLDTLRSNRNVVIDTQMTVAKDDSIKIEIAALHSDSIQWDAVTSYPTIDFTPNTGDTLIKEPVHYDFVPKLLINRMFSDVHHSLFGPLYRGWGQFAYLNDSTDAPGSPILFDQLIVPDYQGYSSVGNNSLPTVTDTSYNGISSALAGSYNPVGGTTRFVAMTANAITKGWMGYGNTTHVMGLKMSNVRRIATTLPQGADPGLMEEMDSPIPQTISGGNANFVEKESRSHPFNVGFTLASTYGINSSRTTNYISLDYLDLNGDRYPDVVSGNSVQYSMPWGGLGTLTPLFTDVRTSGKTHARGGSFGRDYPKTERTTSNAPRKAKFTTSGDGSANGTKADDHSVKGWLDVNGDGLPDMVYNNGTVALNTGYGLLPPENWNMVELRVGESLSGSLSASVSPISLTLFNVMDGSISGGIGMNLSANNSTSVYQDVNGDGLPDCITEQNGVVYVNYNKGNGTWTARATLANVDEISRGENFGENLSAGFTAGFTWGWAKITGSLNASGGHSFNRETAALADINGDGLPDYVTSDGEDRMKVRYNQGGKANLLRRARNFTGSGFTVDYALTPSSYDNPQRQWVMAEVRTRDSFAVQSGADMRTTYEYRNPRYDRYERMSYGFDTVIQRQHSTNGSVYRCYIDGYHNRSFMKHGQKASDMITDGSGHPYVENLYTSKLQDLNNPTIIYDDPDCPVEAFPVLDAEITNYYEGAPLPTITTARSYTYDRYKNVTTFLDRGDISRNDDEITVNFVYQANAGNNLVSLPVEQEVFGHAGNPLRNRQMQYNNEGSPVQLDIVGETETSTISMTYDGYGNLATVLMPENAAGQRYARSYTYDPVLNTYPAKATNSFGESCTFEYDYSRGLCTKQTDPNGNYLVTEYDWLGRPVKVRAPQEIASGAPYTLKIRYSPAKWYGQVRADLSTATTMRYDPQRPTDSIVCVAICDGWGRPLQSKTEYGTASSIVSGSCLYDEFGRAVVQYYPFFGGVPDTVFNPNYNVSTATTTVYDVLDRKKSVIRPDGHGQSMVYGFQNHGGMRFVTAATDANGNTTVSYADARGNTLKVEAPENATTLFEYDDLGRTLQTTDPDGFTTTYSYDLRGRLTATAHPDKGTTTLTYDKAGNLTHKATQKLANQGVDIEYVYDYNRLTEVHYPLLPQNNVIYTYGTSSNTATNANGRLLRVDDGTGYQTFAYDRLGNVAENTRAIALPFEDSVYNFRMLYEYDSWNRVQRIVYPDSEVVTYNYDLGGNLNRVHTYKANHHDTLIKNILYDEFGHRTQVNFGNGVTTNYTYDILQRLSLLETKKPSSPALQKISYSFDLEDNITKVVNTAVGANGLGGAYTNEYNYDDLYRLTSANGSYSGNNTNYSLEMAYTPAGRLCSKLQDFTGTGNVYAYSPNSKQHAVRRIYNGLTNELYNLRWDNNGNLAQQTVYSVANNTTTYQTMRMLFWDEDDRLNLVAGDGYLSYYAYGYDGNRAIKMTGNAAIDQTGTLLNSTNLENITIYPSEYLTVTQAEYTKYYYAGGNRIASKIGTGGFGKMTRLCTLDQSLSYNTNLLFDNVIQQIVSPINQPNDEFPVNVCGGYSVATELLADPLPDFYISQTNLNFTQNNLLQQFRQNLAGGTEASYYFHSDHLGSASWITNNAGLPVQHLQYLPFGELFANEQSTGYNERFTFTGKERDAETGYYYHGARFNSSDIGWLSVDPMADKYPSMTPYNYCAWNPVKLVDPTGEWPEQGVILLVLKASVGLGLSLGVGGSAQRGMAFDRHGLTHFSGYSVTLPHNQQIYSDSKNPTIVMGGGICAGLECSYFSSTNSFFDAIKQNNVSFNLSGHWGAGLNFALGEKSASIGGGVGIDVSIRNEGIFRITESISLSKEEAEKICSYKEWTVSTPIFHENKKGEKYFEATVLTSHIWGLFENNTGITVRSEALKNENGEYVPNGIWVSKKYKLSIENN